MNNEQEGALRIRWPICGSKNEQKYGRYSNIQIPAVLPKVQKGNTSWCNAIENGSQQVAQI